jgi:hypothetical protein
LKCWSRPALQITGKLRIAPTDLAVSSVELPGAATVNLLEHESDLAAAQLLARGRYVAEVHFDYDFNAICWAVFALAICGGGLVVQIDKGDGSPEERIDTPLFSLVSAVCTIPFTRASTAGVVTVTAGLSSHAETGVGLTSMANVELNGTVRQICVRSA